MSVETASIKSPVRTDKVTGRRELRFNSVQDIRNEAERLARSRVQMLGNWSLGQVFQHLAIGINMAIDGASFRAPWYFRIVGRLIKRSFLTKKMPPGFKLPPYAETLLLPAEVSTEDGLRALLTALDRFEREEKRSPSPFLGKLTREESTQLQCRHAELHLSFAVPVT